MMFFDVPVGQECSELNHLGDEVAKYRKENACGIAGMNCNAVLLPEEYPCYVPLDREVILVEV